MKIIPTNNSRICFKQYLFDVHLNILLNFVYFKFITFAHHFLQTSITMRTDHW